MIDESVQVPRDPCHPCILDVEFESILLTSLGVLAVPSMDTQERLDWERRTAKTVWNLLIDVSAWLKALDFTHPWSSLAHEVSFHSANQLAAKCTELPA